ncbi:hypothetical protein QR685DRAFT_450777 [Neurospora intermedia]|uniref:RNase H type-1 domain-containing protein n=1 Tax=Neurospora intermedia TaxID=5142 RepID=A0ABR3D2J0_NEUIN
MTMHSPVRSKIRAERACTSPLWVNGVPQIIIFCDGSRKCERNRESEASSGGYGLVLRYPWANNVNNADNQEGAPASSAAARMPFGFTLKSGFGVRSWSYNKIYSPVIAESGALAQSLLVALPLVEQHRPESVVIELFTDSQERWHRLNHGLNHQP